MRKYKGLSFLIVFIALFNFGLLNISAAEEKLSIDYVAVDKTATYNEKEHTAYVNSTYGTIKYANKNGEYVLDEIPKYINAGEYEIKFKIYRDDNYEVVYDSVFLTINKAQISYYADDETVTYDGKQHTIAVYKEPPFIHDPDDFGENFTIKYADEKGEYVLDEPLKYTNAGVYKIKYKLSIDDNFDTAYHYRTLTINPAPLTYTGKDKTVTYDGNEYGVDLSFAYKKMFADENGEYTLDEMPKYSEAGVYEIKYKLYRNDNYETIYGSNILTINKVKLSYLSDNKTVTYNGNEYGIDLKISSPNVNVKYADENGEYVLDEMPKYLDVGEYEIKYKLFIDDNHETIYDSNILTINKGKILYIANNKTVTYDGNEYGINLKIISPNVNVKYANENGEYVLDEMPKYSDVGEYEIKYKLFIDDNYEIIEGSKNLTILLATISYKGEDKIVTYDGNEYGIDLKINSPNVTIKYADENGEYILDEMPKYSDAGYYEIKYKIFGDNYREPKEGINAVIIGTALIYYDVPSSHQFVYDGEEHGIELEITTPNVNVKYADENGEYTLDEMPKYINVGEYKIKFKLYIDDNYETIYGSSTIKILKANLNVDYTVSNYRETYDGLFHTFGLKIKTPNINVKYADENGEYTLDEMPKYSDAGYYEIKFKLFLNDNYKEIYDYGYVTIYQAYISIETKPKLINNSTYQFEIIPSNIKDPVIKYMDENGEYTLDEIPNYTAPGEYLIYFKIFGGNNYRDYEGSQKVVKFDINLSVNESKTNQILLDDESEYTIKIETNPIGLSFENITYESSNEDIVEILENGNFKAKSLGSAVITIKSGDIILGIQNIEVVNDDDIYLVKKDDSYWGTTFYLFSDGNLYKSGDENYLKFVKKNVKDFSVVEYDYVLYVDNDNNLYKYNYRYYQEEELIATNIKEINCTLDYDYNYNYILTNDNELYAYENGNTKFLVGNVKSYDNGMILTQNNELYVYGKNIYGEKFNNNQSISVPILFYNNVKDYNYFDQYILLENGNYIKFSSYVVSAQVIETNVDKIYSSNYILKDNKIYRIDIGINEKNFVTNLFLMDWLPTIDNISDSDFDRGFVLIENQLYIKDNGVQENGYKIIANNVKQAFVVAFDYTDISYIHYITNDNKLYRYYNNESYYIIDKIDKYDYSLKAFKTINNEYWVWGYNINNKLGVILGQEVVDYPSKIVKGENATIKAQGIYIYEGTKKDITVDDKLNILGIILPYNVTNKNIIWSVNDSELASISQDGELTALKEGVVIITATTLDGNYEATFTINIHPKASSVVSIVPNNNFTEIGKNSTDTWEYAFVIYAKVGNENVIERDVIWSSSDTSILKVESLSYCQIWNNDSSEYEIYDGCARILVSNKLGNANIIVTTKDGRISYSKEFKVVENYNVLSFTEEVIEIKLGDTYDLKNNITFNGFDVNNLRFEVENTNAEISDSGIIKTISSGRNWIRVYSKLANSINEFIHTFIINIKEKLTPIFNSILGILDTTKSVIRNIKASTTVKQLIDSVENNDGVNIYTTNNELATGIIKTGYKLKYFDGSIDKQYALSVLGDVSGDGAINSADLLRIRQHLLSIKILDNEYYISADITEDGTINSADLLRIRQHLLGSKPIS